MDTDIKTDNTEDDILSPPAPPEANDAGSDITDTPPQDKVPAARSPKEKKKAAKPKAKPECPMGVVCPEQLKKGVKKARKQIMGITQEISGIAGKDDTIREIEFSASFGADGRFLGIGTGGEASIKIKMSPKKGKK